MKSAAEIYSFEDKKTRKFHVKSRIKVITGFSFDVQDMMGYRRLLFLQVNEGWGDIGRKYMDD